MWQPTKPERDPTVEKSAVLKKAESHLGATTQAAARRPDWRISANRTSVFITFSKDEDLFYDVSEVDLEAWAAYPRSFVIFVMGTGDDALVLPLAVLRDRRLGRMKPKERGNFKLHISGSTHLRFREVPHVDLDDYRNAFELLDE